MTEMNSITNTSTSNERRFLTDIPNSTIKHITDDEQKRKELVSNARTYSMKSDLSLWPEKPELWDLERIDIYPDTTTVDKRRTSCHESSFHGSSTHVSIANSDRAVIGGIQYNNIEPERLHYQNILDLTDSALQQVNDDKAIVKTKWFKEAFKRVVGFQRVLILSNFGEGRTTLGKQVMLELQNDTHALCQKKTPMIIRTPNEWRLAVNPKSDIVVFLDDAFGKFAVDHSYQKWQKILPDIYTCINDSNSSVCLIIAMNKFIYNSIKDSLELFDLFSNMEKFTIDISYLDMEDRESILKSYYKCLRGDELYAATIQEILNVRNPSCFPLCCCSFAKTPKYRKQGASFFINPVEVLRPYIKYLCEMNENVFVFSSLVLFLKPDMLSVNSFSLYACTTMIKQLREVLSLQTTPNAGAMTETFELIKDVLVIECNGQIQFITEPVRNSLVKILGKKHRNYLLENLDLKLLITQSITLSKNEKKTTIFTNEYNIIVGRLIREVKINLSNMKTIVYLMKLFANSDIFQDHSLTEMFVHELVRMDKYKMIIRCQESEDSVNLLSTLLSPVETRACYELAQSLLEATPDNDCKCCCKMNSWFLEEIDRSFIHARRQNHQNAISILQRYAREF